MFGSSLTGKQYDEHVSAHTLVLLEWVYPRALKPYIFPPVTASNYTNIPPHFMFSRTFKVHIFCCYARY